MAAKKSVKATTGRGKMILPGAAGPQRKHHCREHDEPCRPVKIFGLKRVRFSCSQGCDLNKGETILK